MGLCQSSQQLILPYGLAIGILNLECVSKWHECDNLTDYQRFVFLAFITVSKANKIQTNHTLALIQSSLIHLKLFWGHLNQAPSDTIGPGPPMYSQSENHGPFGTGPGTGLSMAELIF